MKEEIIESLKKSIKEYIKSEFDLDITPNFETPNDSTHGDLSTNIAMQLAGKLGKNSREIAEAIKLQITNYKLQKGTADLNLIDEVNVAGAGFINFKFKQDSFKEVLHEVLKKRDDFGKSNLGEGKQVMIEFGQPNTHKAFHIGHLKSAISGLSMVKLHENLGYEVVKANFFGDVGMQVAKPTWAFLQKGKPDGFDSWNVHDKMKFIDECYVYGAGKFKDDGMAAVEIKQINKDIYANVSNESVKIYKELREISLEHQNEIWKSLGITYDREYPESEVFPEAIKIVEENRSKVFEESEGAIIFNGEKIGLTTWVFLTSEGNPTYSAKDLALASMKFREYPNLYKSIVTTSVEINAYFKVVIHVLGLILPKSIGKYFHIPFGWMLRGGKKFSSRMGGSVKGTDVLNEVKEVAMEKISELKEYEKEEKEKIVHAVANAGLKFLILSHEFHKDFSYEPEVFLSFEGFSGPYILYSYARAKSILRNAFLGGVYPEERKVQDDEVNVRSTEGATSTSRLPEDLENVLNNEYEQNLLKALGNYSSTAEKAGITVQPHLIANYLFDLAGKFNQFYNNCRVLEAESEDDKQARLALTEATSIVLKNGLGLLGIETVEKM